jgi:hypothetical protein
MSARGDLAVVIPARNESVRISATVRAAATIPGVDIVVVVDDGSTDGTGAEAELAGAFVARHARNLGKAAAMETGAEAVLLIESERDNRDAAGRLVPPGDSGGRPQGPAPRNGSRGRPPAPAPRHLLFLDADLASTAGHAAALTEPVRSGEADMSIAVFASHAKLGGHGLVLGLAGAGIERVTGWRPTEPLNGQRCLTRAAFEAAKPLAAGWGAETGLTIDLLRKGMRITEVQVPLSHRATGKDLHSQLHRAHQFADVARALAARKPWRQPAGRQASQPAGRQASQPAGQPDTT